MTLLLKKQRYSKDVKEEVGNKESTKELQWKAYISWTLSSSSLPYAKCHVHRPTTNQSTDRQTYRQNNIFMPQTAFVVWCNLYCPDVVPALVHHRHRHLPISWSSGKNKKLRKIKRPVLMSRLIRLTEPLETPPLGWKYRQTDRLSNDSFKAFQRV